MVLVLSGCASPSPEFAGGSRQSVMRDGREFVVVQLGNRAQVIRVGWAGPAERRGMLAIMIGAMEQATGCTAIAGTIEGDTGALRARLRCPAGKGAAAP